MYALDSTSSFFFFHDTATTEIYTLSLHDALPISPVLLGGRLDRVDRRLARDEVAPLGDVARRVDVRHARAQVRSEEHTSELQSLTNLVCRLLLEKKKKHFKTDNT